MDEYYEQPSYCFLFKSEVNDKSYVVEIKHDGESWKLLSPVETYKQETYSANGLDSRVPDTENDMFFGILEKMSMTFSVYSTVTVNLSGPAYLFLYQLANNDMEDMTLDDFVFSCISTFNSSLH